MPTLRMLVSNAFISPSTTSAPSSLPLSALPPSYWAEALQYSAYVRHHITHSTTGVCPEYAIPKGVSKVEANAGEAERVLRILGGKRREDWKARRRDLRGLAAEGRKERKERRKGKWLDLRYVWASGERKIKLSMSALNHRLAKETKEESETDLPPMQITGEHSL
jgi:hypothetical protein